jgi:hypothetical protein
VNFFFFGFLGSDGDVEDEEHKQEWSSPLEFLLSCIAMSVGLGSETFHLLYWLVLLIRILFLNADSKIQCLNDFIFICVLAQRETG